MKTIRFKKFIIAVSLSSLLFSADSKASFELPPVLASDHEKANFLGYIAKEIPWLLMEGAEYDVNFLQLLESQNLVVQTLSQDKTYLKDIEKRKALVELVVDVETDGFIKERTASKELKAAMTSARKNGSADAYVEQIAKLYLDFSTKNYRSIATGLITSLPADSKGKLFKLTPEEQIEALSKHPSVTDEFVKAKFRAETVGLKATQLTRDILFDYMKQGQALELELVASILAYYMDSKEIPANGLKKVLADFNWLAELNLKGIKNEDVRKFFNTAIKKYVDAEDVSARVSAGQFTIREVPPYLGMFRGIVGADCATQYSSTIVYAARERTFFIYDDSGNLKGYATATNVKDSSGKKYLYLHDVTGARLSVQLMKDVFHAISENISTFGAQGVLLPDAAQIERNNNYFPLRGWQQSLLESRRATGIEMEYPDAESRQSIFNTRTVANIEYDSPETNTHGYKLILPKEEIARYYKANASERVEPLKLKNLDKKEVVFLTLALTYGAYSRDAIDSLNQATAVADGGHASNFKQRIAVANQIAKAWGYTQTSIAELAGHLANGHRYKLKDYYKNMTDSFKKLGIELTEADIAKNQYLFYQGHVQAADAGATAESARKTVAAGLWLLKRWPTPTSVVSSFQTNPNPFLESTAFLNYVNSLVSTQATQLRQLRWLIESAGLDAILLENKGADLEKLRSNKDEEVNKEASAIFQYLEKRQKEVGVKCAI